MTKNKVVLLNKKPIAARFFNKILIAKMRILPWLFIVAMPTSPIYAFEDNAARQVQATISLSEAIKRTFNHHPDMQTFKYRLEAQQGRVIQASLSPKPEVELTIEDAFGSGDFGGFDNAETTLSVSWVLDQSIKERRTELASRGVNLIESERAIKQLDAATQTAGYYLNALSHQERQVIASRAISLAKTTVNEIKNRIKVGKTPLAELYRAEAELAKRQLVLVNLKYKLNASLRQIAAQWGSTTPTFRSVLGSLMVQPNLISFEALKKQIKHNPNLTKYLSLERVKQAELKLAQKERGLLWKFSTGVKRFEQTGDFGVVAGISVPFGGSNSNQGRIAEVRAKLSQNQSEADAQRLSIETSLFIVYQQLEHSLHLGDILKHKIIPRLEKALKETQKAYELGKYSYLDWLAVQNDLLDAQSALLDANLTAHLNKIELERLTGAQISSPF